MSLTFSQLTDKIDRVCNTNSTSYPTTLKTVDINIALAEVYEMILRVNGWNVDDFNHTDYPIITTDIVSGQRDYSFTYDEQTNLILGIHKVMVKDSASGVFQELEAVDQQTQDVSSFYDGQNGAGIPIRYDKTANGIFLDPIPNYNSTGGLKVFIDREPSFFVYTDTTKVAGFDGLCHDYLYLKPSYEYCRDKGLQSAERLYRDLQDSIKRLKDRYAYKDRDFATRIQYKIESNK